MKYVPKRGYIAIHKGPLVQQCMVEARDSVSKERTIMSDNFLYSSTRGEYESVEDAEVDLQELQEREA
jgi:hypothetical protein